MNCAKGPTVTPCLKCERCQEIAQGRSLDVLEIDGASNRGIDQIRTLRELAKFTPAAGAFKVYIIDEVHQITAEGFNALLKTLEEPPPHVLFILATTAPHKVPATILSRCQRYDFKRLAFDAIIGKLKSIAKEEKLTLAEEAAIGIARAASGSLRDAESILDQVAAFTSGKIRAEDVKTLLGTVDEDVFAEAMNGIKARDPVRLLKLVADAVGSGTDLIQWVLDFLSFLRNLLVARVGAGPLGFEEMGAEQIGRVTLLAKEFSVEELTVIAQTLAGVVEMMRRVGEPRIPLEMALVRLSAGESLASVTELLARLDKLNEQFQEEPPGSAASPEAPRPPEQAAAPPAAPSSDSTDSPVALDKVTAAWPALLDELHKKKASIAAYLSEAAPLAVESGDPPQIVVGFPKGKGFEFHREALDRLSTRRFIEETLAALIGSPIRCAFQITDGVPVRAPSLKETAPSTPELPQQPANPLLDSVVNLFEGRVLPGEG